MSNVIFNKIIAKFSRLDEYLGYLSTLKNATQEQFIADHQLYGLAERYLQLAIETLLDIGKLLVLSQNAPRPESNQDIFTTLKDQGIISDDCEFRFRGISGFRNILVHDYEKIDRGIIYEKLQHNLDDFFLFKKEIIAYIDGKR